MSTLKKQLASYLDALYYIKTFTPLYPYDALHIDIISFRKVYTVYFTLSIIYQI